VQEVQTEIPETRVSARSERPREPLERVASAAGNRGFASVVARMRQGEGILPGGVVHPDVEAAISASRGRGQPLETGVRDTLEKRLAAPLDDVRIHTGDQADTVARAVSARAFTVGSDIYFSREESQAAGREPSALVTAKVAHVLEHYEFRIAAHLRAGRLQRPLDPRAGLIPQLARVGLQSAVREPQRPGCDLGKLRGTSGGTGWIVGSSSSASSR
jgi:Domain of unknown function (DUF4157)